MKLIGAGFGRTGTTSLQAALHELGLEPCYHMKTILKDPRHLGWWIDAGEGRPVDWKAMFQGYQATMDWPGSAFYKPLLEAFPDAKVLLSVRDPEKWYASAHNTIYSVLHSFPRSWLTRVLPMQRRLRRMADCIIWKGTFQGRFTDKQFAIDVFNRHIEEVKRHVPADRLLIHDVKEGWEPLCRFLGVEVPRDKPFPRLNDTAYFQDFARQQERSWLRNPLRLLRP